ncbi:hypothetical protein ACO34A_19180 [Rhizobium sp. ACO-34A]|nr:hypothetical protein ACO34A_19180 [Rhizobium sp. ACO-34A]
MVATLHQAGWIVNVKRGKFNSGASELDDWLHRCARTNQTSGNHASSSGARIRVAESFFNLLKRERIRRRVYRSRDEARRDVFDYIEMFYNPKRKHVRNGMLSSVEFEKQQKI